MNSKKLITTQFMKTYLKSFNCRMGLRKKIDEMQIATKTKIEITNDIRKHLEKKIPNQSQSISISSIKDSFWNFF